MPYDLTGLGRTIIVVLADVVPDVDVAYDGAPGVQHLVGKQLQYGLMQFLVLPGQGQTELLSYMGVVLLWVSAWVCASVAYIGYLCFVLFVESDVRALLFVYFFVLALLLFGVLLLVVHGCICGWV